MSQPPNIQAYSTGTSQHRVSMSDDPALVMKKQLRGHNEELPLQACGAGNDEERRGFRNISGARDDTRRKLKSRHIQLIGIGGTIGTALFVQIGEGLVEGGPGSLFLAFTLWCSVNVCVTSGMVEMVTYLPISSPFIRFAGRYVDEAFGFAAGWNFFVFEAILAPFYITVCSVIVHYWSDEVPAGGMIAMVLVLYAILNLTSVQWYGETEFWAAMGKVVLAVGLIIFTIIVMLGGNPAGDRFGFENWNNPGSFRSFHAEGDLGRFLGFLQCLVLASFTIAGPDYVSMAAGEAENPRVVMPQAYNAVFYRLTSFFILGSLCVGINVPYNDPKLEGFFGDPDRRAPAFDNAQYQAAASPYVISMERLDIRVLPHIVNALILASAFSAGNSYVYCASRSLFGLALEGKAPRLLTRTTRRGVPVYCVALVLFICLLAFLQVTSSSATVLGWFVGLVRTSQLINFSCMTATFLCWRRALHAQGVSLDHLPYVSIMQPYAAWYALICTTSMVFIGGYTVFLSGRWDPAEFVFSYFSAALFPALYFGWKFIKKTRIHKPDHVDLVGEVEEINEYTRNFVPQLWRNVFDKWLNIIFGS